MVERAAVVCGSARCSPYNQVFLEAGEGRAHRRSRLSRWALRRKADCRLSRPWAASMPAGCCRMASIATSSGARPASPRWKTISFAPGTTLTPGAMPTICRRRPASGRLATSAAAVAFGGDLDRALAAIKVAHAADAGRDRSLLRPSAITRPSCQARQRKIRGAASDPIGFHGHRAGQPRQYPQRSGLHQAPRSQLFSRSTAGLRSLSDATVTEAQHRLKCRLTPAMLRELMSAVRSAKVRVRAPATTPRIMPVGRADLAGHVGATAFSGRVPLMAAQALFRRLPVHGGARDRAQDGPQEPRARISPSAISRPS